MLTFFFICCCCCGWTVILYLQGNSFDGDSLEPLCGQVATRRVDNPGYLQFMAADCLSPAGTPDDVTAISCTCCSECF